MAFPSIYLQETTDSLSVRISALTNETPALWGKMDVAQMLAHCNVTYEYLYTDKHPKPNFLIKLILKLFVKGKVVGDKLEYAKNSPTAPEFKMSDKKSFEKERDLLIQNILRTQELGEAYFDNRESHSFGVLTKNEWNNMFFYSIMKFKARFFGVVKASHLFEFVISIIVKSGIFC